jgi:hypothetical protein
MEAMARDVPRAKKGSRDAYLIENIFFYISGGGNGKSLKFTLL